MDSSSSLPNSNTIYAEENVAVSGMVVVTTSGGEKFKVQSEVVRQFSETIRQMIDERGSYDEIRRSFPNITGEIMAKMMEYCNKHAGSSNLDEAANYLNIKSLLDLVCQTVTDMIKGKTPEEIYKTFGIKKP